MKYVSTFPYNVYFHRHRYVFRKCELSSLRSRIMGTFICTAFEVSSQWLCTDFTIRKGSFHLEKHKRTMQMSSDDILEGTASGEGPARWRRWQVNWLYPLTGICVLLTSYILPVNVCGLELLVSKMNTFHSSLNPVRLHIFHNWYVCSLSVPVH